MNLKRTIILCALCIIGVFVLTGCDNKDNIDGVKKKVDSEIKYLETSIDNISEEIIVKKYEKNKEEQDSNSDSGEKNASKENDENLENEDKKEEKNDTNKDKIKEYVINWEQMDKELEKIYSTWTSLAIDLNKLGVENSDILGFGENINNVKLSIQSKNESMLLQSIANLYSFIPKYMALYSEDSFEIAKKNIKYYLMNSGSYAQSQNWDECLAQIESAENEYVKLMNNVNYVSENSYNVNRVYVLLEELKSSISYKNFEIFLLKYEVLMNEF